MESLFLCGGLVGDCVWWLTTESGYTTEGRKEKTSAAESMINVGIVAVFLCEQPSLRGR